MIAVQLDNEIGMLAWVTNSPDLTPGLLADFRHWLAGRPAGLAAYPADSGDDRVWARVVRSPAEAWAGPLRVDLARFMRNRFARYAATLRTMAEEFGVRDVPFLINIHGTDAGSAEPFPIGISQLAETYAGLPGMMSGSDHYVGELTLASTPDLYLLNAFQAAVHGPDQPLTSIEFEAGSGDYGGGMDVQTDPSTVELKTRLFLAQGNRLLNYYLFAGGHNRPLDQAIGDGADRIAFTGERHGTAAPVGPEGQLGLGFAATVRAGRFARTLSPWLAAMRPEPDNLQLGLVLDAYATEYTHPGSPLMTGVRDDLVRHRGSGPRRALSRSALLLGYQFDAVWLERNDPRAGAVLMMSSGAHLDAPVQRRLADFVAGGGQLLLLGRLPQADLAGADCTILADALDVRSLGMDWGGPFRFLTAVAHGWAAPWPATRVGWLERLDPGSGLVLLTDNDGTPCGVELRLGRGRVVLLTAELPSDRELFGRVLSRLGARQRLHVESPVPGVFAMTSATDDGQRLLHLLNITGHSPAVSVSFDGGATRRLTLPPRTGAALPIGLVTPFGVIESADAELIELGSDRLGFATGLAGAESSVRFRGQRPTVAGAQLTQSDGAWLVTGAGPATLRFG